MHCFPVLPVHEQSSPSSKSAHQQGHSVSLVIDPATSTGYCLIRIIGGIADIYQYGRLVVSTSSPFQGDHCIDLMRQLSSIVEDHDVTHIAVEDYFASGKFCSGCSVNIAFRTAIYILARERNIPYTILNISLWKAYVAGSSRPTAPQQKQWGKLAANKLFIQDALFKKYGFRFPGKIANPLNGRFLKFPSDIVDAVAQGVYFCMKICEVSTVNMSAPLIEAPGPMPKNGYIYSSPLEV
jgi:Holliday junction resolvasome RuvABC endonuclease subunit